MSNVQPLYKGGNPSFPLGAGPYHSRTEKQNVEFSDLITDPPKNYQFVAFRPGFSLQASELCEMQENMQMQMSLSIAMMHNWITSGSGHQWSQWNANSPGGEGGQLNVDSLQLPPNTGIGVGGGYDGVTPSHDQQFVVSGPGWRGATPLHPFISPYQNDSPTSSVSVVKTASSYAFTFNPGWWLVESKGWWNDEDEQPQQVSGLKYWVYLHEKEEITVNASGLGNNQWITVGLTIDEKYVSCGSNDDDDPELADNATGSPNAASCGASRYKVYISGANSVAGELGQWQSDSSAAKFKDRENMNPVCVIRGDDNSVRYMNNLLIDAN
tara:strand:- start:138 stop:1115 length:978 start_codon:yes stop_codon:yes gene_type:complete